MKRLLFAVLASLAVLASPRAAVAGAPYGFPGTSLSLSYTNGTFLAAIDGSQSIYDVGLRPHIDRLAQTGRIVKESATGAIRHWVRRVHLDLGG